MAKVGKRKTGRKDGREVRKGKIGREGRKDNQEK